MANKHRKRMRSMQLTAAEVDLVNWACRIFTLSPAEAIELLGALGKFLSGHNWPAVASPTESPDAAQRS